LGWRFSCFFDFKSFFRSGKNPEARAPAGLIDIDVRHWGDSLPITKAARRVGGRSHTPGAPCSLAGSGRFRGSTDLSLGKHSFELNDFLNPIVEAVNRIEGDKTNLTYDEFAQNTRDQDAVIRNFEVIGEASRT
jgi:hypothetical protein